MVLLNFFFHLVIVLCHGKETKNWCYQNDHWSNLDTKTGSINKLIISINSNHCCLTICRTAIISLPVWRLHPQQQGFITILSQSSERFLPFLLFCLVGWFVAKEVLQRNENRGLCHFLRLNNRMKENYSACQYMLAIHVSIQVDGYTGEK